MPTAFYCRAKPQGCDAIEIFRSAHRVFIGYPLVRRGAIYNPRALASCLVNPTCHDEEWADQIPDNSKMYSQNRNFIPTVEPDSIVLIPRPSDGSAYLGRIEGNFEIVNCPGWGQKYLQLRAEQNLDVDDKANQHIADVAQGWKVNGYTRIDYSLLPGWLRSSLLGRSTYGKLCPHPINEEITAYSVLDDILDGKQKAKMEWSLEPKIVKNRLVDSLSNSCAFENLVIALLQLENPDLIWHHTGGTGDGGVDGFASNDAGKIVGLMQAKYKSDDVPVMGGHITDDKKVLRYGAVFLPEKPKDPEDGTTVLNLDWIVSAVCRHWSSLPLALTLRIGERKDFDVT